MHNNNLIGPWIRRFLLEHLVAERNLARNTQISYRDTLVLLLPFMGRTLKRPVDRLAVEEMSPQVVRRFLEHLEKERNCSGATRNLRLGAIHSLAKFIGVHSPEHLAWCAAVRTVPFRKVSQPTMAYLDKPEMDAVLSAPDRRTEQGARDYAVLLFLYNTGARVDEAVHVTVGDLTWTGCSSVQLMGKGSKLRRCPLWPQTVSVLKELARSRTAQERVFLNRLGQVAPATQSMTLQNALHQDLSPAGAMALLVFFAFAMQCTSTLAVVRRETNSWKWPVVQFVYMTGIAYSAALLVNQVLSRFLR
jgi:integrase/recombinase XerD